MCDCIDRINEGLETAGKPDRLLLSTAINTKSGQFRDVLAIYTTKYTKAGNPKNGLPIFANFCPFCGERYEVEYREER